MAFCWTHSIVSMSCLVLEIPTPDPTLHLCLTNANRGKELFPLTYWSPSALCSPGGCGLCCKGALPVLQVPNVLFSKTAFQVLWLKHALVLGVIPPQEQNLTSSLIELYKVPVSPFLQPVQGPLHGRPTLWCTSPSSHFCIFCKRAEDAPCPIIQVINEDSEQCSP